MVGQCSVSDYILIKEQGLLGGGGQSLCSD